MNVLPVVQSVSQDNMVLSVFFTDSFNGIIRYHCKYFLAQYSPTELRNQKC